MIRNLYSLLILGTIASTVIAGPYECSGEGPNKSPVLDIKPKLTGEVKNGKSWLLKEGNNVIYMAKLNGTAYEMGYAFGQLYGNEIADNIKGMNEYYRILLLDMFIKQYGFDDTVNYILSLIAQ